MRIPPTGLDKDTLFQRLEAYRADDLDTHSGRVWAYLYDAGRDVFEVGQRAYAMYLKENGLDPTAFRSLLRFEREIVDMARAHLNGPEGVVGTFTSGGTESILLAVKAARERARGRGTLGEDGREVGEIVLPVTAHAAFHKAAHYFGLKVVVTPVGDDGRADAAAIREAITERTVLVVASASSYGPGVVDPVTEIAAAAAERDVLCHVDGCIGGFLLPYFKRLGADVPDFDFTVPGVTSISMDLHKYAFAPKGASVLLHRDASLRMNQIFACAGWAGYPVINMGVQSSKTGGPLAAAWAVLQYVGDEGYLELARRTLDATTRLCDGIEAMDGLELVARPDMSLVAFHSREVEILHVIDEMNAMGWYVQGQLGRGGIPRSAHLIVSPTHDEYVDAFLADLGKAVETARTMRSSGLGAGVAKMFAGVDPAEMDAAMFDRLLGIAGIKGTALPDRMADINEVLDALPPAVTERLLATFLNELFQ